MDKIDARIVNQLKVSSKVSHKLVKTLENEDERADAIVRVRNPLHLGFLERSFDVVASYPFIRSIGIKCGLEDAIRLERMSEVEYVAAQSKVFALGKGKDESNNEKHCETDNEIVAHSSDNAEVLRRADKARNAEFAQSNRMFYPIPTFDDNLDGRGVTLCVMDTGVSPHIDLSVPKNRIIGAIDFVNGEKYAYDDNGHGTFVAGVVRKRYIVGKGNQRRCAYGERAVRQSHRKEWRERNVQNFGRYAMAFRQFQAARRESCVYEFRRRAAGICRSAENRRGNACKKRTYRGRGIGKQRCKRFEIACDKQRSYCRRRSG